MVLGIIELVCVIMYLGLFQHEPSHCSVSPVLYSVCQSISELYVCSSYILAVFYQMLAV